MDEEMEIGTDRRRETALWLREQLAEIQLTLPAEWWRLYHMSPASGPVTTRQSR